MQGTASLLILVTMPVLDDLKRGADGPPTAHYDRIKDPALRTLVSELTNLFLVDAAEAVLRGDGTQVPEVVREYAERSPKLARTPSVGTVLARHLAAKDRQDKRRVYAQVFGRPRTVEIPGRGPRHIRALLQPRASDNVIDRVHYAKRAAALLSPDARIDPKDVKRWNHHFSLVLSRLTATPLLPGGKPGGDPAPTPGGGTPGGGTPPPAPNFLRFYVHEIACDDDTRELDKDEITLAGVQLDGDAPSTSSYPTDATLLTFDPYDAGTFKTGDRKPYSPPRRLCSFPLDASTGYPHYFSANLVLAEIDNGGLADFIEELYAAIAVNVAAIITAAGVAIGAAIASGAAAGSLLGSIGGPIGTVIGVVVGLIVGALVGALAASLRDEIFSPFPAECFLLDPYGGFNGQSSTPVETTTFTGFGGSYDVTYSWRLE